MDAEQLVDDFDQDLAAALDDDFDNDDEVEEDLPVRPAKMPRLAAEVR